MVPVGVSERDCSFRRVGADSRESGGPMSAFHLWIDLLKLRIASVITLTGVSAAALTSPTWPKAQTTALLALALLLASAGAGALNHVIDFDIDARMERTRRRPLPAGKITRRCAIVVGLALSVVALTTALLYLNRIVALHLFSGWFVYVIDRKSTRLN